MDDDNNVELFAEFDVGNLSVWDFSPLDLNRLKNAVEDNLKQLAQNNAQLLINKIWELPTERNEDAIVVRLPKETTRIPRAKPIPKPKLPTRWEQYAKEKGIRKAKKDKLVWDEMEKVWKPRYGYRGINNPRKDWLIEVPDNADPNTDMFQKSSEERKEKSSKNEFQRLRNIARAQKLKMPNNTLVEEGVPSKKQLSGAIVNAKRSTASIGKFKESLADSKEAKQVGKKRKFQSNFGSLREEKNASLKILENLERKAPKLDVTKAVNFQNLQEESKAPKKKVRAQAEGKKKKNSKGYLKKKQRRH